MTSHPLAWIDLFGTRQMYLFFWQSASLKASSLRFIWRAQVELQLREIRWKHCISRAISHLGTHHNNLRSYHLHTIHRWFNFFFFLKAMWGYFAQMSSRKSERKLVTFAGKCLPRRALFRGGISVASFFSRLVSWAKKNGLMGSFNSQQRRQRPSGCASLLWNLTRGKSSHNFSRKTSPPSWLLCKKNKSYPEYGCIRRAERMGREVKTLSCRGFDSKKRWNKWENMRPFALRFLFASN